MAEPTGATTDKKTGSRTYLHPVTGKRLRSVTTVKNMIGGKDFGPWQAKLAAERALDNWEHVTSELAKCKTKKAREELRKWISRAAVESRDAAGVRGTAVHDYAEARLNGWETDLKPELEPYVIGYEAFINDHQPKFSFTEKTFVNDRYDYAGTADFGASMFSTFDQTVIGDWKTGATGPWVDWAYQLTAYSRGTHTLEHKCLECQVLSGHTDACKRSTGTVVALGRMPVVSQTRACVVRLLPNRYELHWIGKDPLTMAVLWEGFKSALVLDKINQATGTRDANVFERG